MTSGSKTPDELTTIDMALADIDRRMKILRNINPSGESQEAERARFFTELEQGNVYNPNFTYLPRTVDPDEIHQALEAIEITGTSAIEQLFAIQLDYLSRTLAAIEARGTPALTGAAILLHGTPEPELVKLAKETLATISLNEEPAVHTADEMVIFAREHLHKLGYDQLGWTVKVDPDIAATLMVSSGEQEVLVKKGATFTDAERITLLAHEIDGHVRRKINGERFGYVTLGLGIGDYIRTEEGLCLHLEEQAGGLTPYRWMQICARVLAVDTALTGSFYETFKQLRDCDVPKDLAYSVTARVKRGLTDTSEPGGYVKDYVYLAGMVEVQEYLTGHPLDDLLLAPVALEHIPLVKALALSQ